MKYLIHPSSLIQCNSHKRCARACARWLQSDSNTMVWKPVQMFPETLRDYCCLHPPEPWTSEICSQTTRTLWWAMKLGRCEEENQTADCFSGLHKTQTHNRQIKGFVWLWNPAELHLWNKHRYGGWVLDGGKVRLCSRINLLPSLLCICFHSANIPVWRLTLSVRPEIRSSERLIESYFTLPAVQ